MSSSVVRHSTRVLAGRSLRIVIGHQVQRVVVLAVVAGVLGLAVLVLRSGGAQGPEAPALVTTVLLSIPARPGEPAGDPGSLTVEPGGMEQPASGPAAIDVAPDGTIWIADAAPRAVGYTRDGSVRTVLDLSGRVAGVADIDVGDRAALVLDVSTSTVLLVDLATGDVQRTAVLPEAAGLAGGLSGVAFGPAGEVLAELHGGTETVRIVGFGDPARVVGLDARPTAVGPVAIRYPLTQDAPVRVTVGGLLIEVEVPETGGVRLLAASERGIDIVVAETTERADGTASVTETVRRYAPDGRLTAVAILPGPDIWVADSAAVDLDGAVLVLVVHEHEVDVVRVPFAPAG